MNNLGIKRSPNGNDLLRASALAWYQPERIEEIAEVCAVDADDVAAVLTEPRGRIEALKELERMRETGELVKLLALPVLEKYVRRASSAMDDATISPATLTRIADTTLKLSGLAEERSVNLRREANKAQGFASIFVTREGIDPVPPPEKPGENRIHIIFPKAAQKRSESIIDAEVVDDDAKS